MPDLPENTHTLVESGEDGRPDLSDICRLIAWSRTSDAIAVSVASATGASLTVEWFDADGALRRVVEDKPTPARGEAFFVGPHGEVYDANGEAL